MLCPTASRLESGLEMMIASMWQMKSLLNKLLSLELDQGRSIEVIGESLTEINRSSWPTFAHKWVVNGTNEHSGLMCHEFYAEYLKAVRKFQLSPVPHRPRNLDRCDAASRKRKESCTHESLQMNSLTSEQIRSPAQENGNFSSGP